MFTSTSGERRSPIFWIITGGLILLLLLFLFSVVWFKWGQDNQNAFFLWDRHDRNARMESHFDSLTRALQAANVKLDSANRQLQRKQEAIQVKSEVNTTLERELLAQREFYADALSDTRNDFRNEIRQLQQSTKLSLTTSRDGQLVTIAKDSVATTRVKDTATGKWVSQRDLLKMINYTDRQGWFKLKGMINLDSDSLQFDSWFVSKYELVSVEKERDKRFSLDYFAPYHYVVKLRNLNPHDSEEGKVVTLRFPAHAKGVKGIEQARQRINRQKKKS